MVGARLAHGRRHNLALQLLGARRQAQLLRETAAGCFRPTLVTADLRAGQRPCFLSIAAEQHATTVGLDDQDADAAIRAIRGLGFLHASTS
eukprot:scaffold101644_cov61-Phaeocystis_antarctica.AAC.3